MPFSDPRRRRLALLVGVCLLLVVAVAVATCNRAGVDRVRPEDGVTRAATPGAAAGAQFDRVAWLNKNQMYIGVSPIPKGHPAIR